MMHDDESIDTETSALCPSCGNPLRDTTPDGDCPACLLGAGIADDATDPDATLAFPELESGTRVGYLGDYELLEEIGRGGMGVVYRANQTSLDRPVAVKLLLGGSWASEEARQRFLLEARAAATVQHPSIVAVHEVGEHEGQPYFSMDLIEGEDLGKLLERGVPIPEQAALWIRDISDAARAAHEHGIVHRDLKPSNVILDRDLRPFVTDFGLARIDDGRGRPVATLTGQVLGTPGYLAPERLTRNRCDVAGDIYSLGTMLYALLTGAAPFAGDSVLEALRRATTEEPTPPRRIRPEVPQDLEAICAKCLAQNPEDRYPNAEELVRDLDRFLDDRPVLARSVPLGYRGLRALRRHRGIAAGFLIIAGLLILTVSQVRSRQKAVLTAQVRAQQQELNLSRWMAMREHRSRGERTAAAELFDQVAGTSAPYRVVTDQELETEAMEIWRLPEIRRVFRQASPGFAVAFSQTGDRFALLTSSPSQPRAQGLQRGDLEIYETLDGALVERSPVRFRADGRWLDLSGPMPSRAYPAAELPTGGSVKVFDPRCGCLAELRWPAELSAQAPELLWIFDPQSSGVVADGEQRLHGWRSGKTAWPLGVQGRPLRFLSERRLLYLADDGRQVFDLETQQATPRGLRGEPVAFSPDGSVAILRSAGLMTLSDTARHQDFRHFKTDIDRNHVLLSVDGTRLAWVDRNDRRLRVWSSLKPDRLPLELEGSHRLGLLPLTRGSFSPDGRFLALPGLENARSWVFIWNAVSGELLFRLDDQMAVLWGPDGRALATFGQLGEPAEMAPAASGVPAASGLGVSIWRFEGGLGQLPLPGPASQLAEGRSLRLRPVPVKPLKSVEFSTAGELLVADEHWRAESSSGAPIWRHNLPIPGFSPRPGTRHEWAGDGAGGAVLVEIPELAELYDRPDGQTVRLGGTDNPRPPLRLAWPGKLRDIGDWAFPSAPRVVELEWSDHGRGDDVAFFPEAYAFARGGSVLWTAGAFMRPTSGGYKFVGFSIDLWDPTTGQHQRTVATREQITRLEASPDGLSVAGGGQAKWAGGGEQSGKDDAGGVDISERGVSIWRAEDGLRLATLPHPVLPSALAWDAEGRVLVSGHEGGRIAWSGFDEDARPGSESRWSSGLGRIETMVVDPATGRFLAGDDQGVLLVFDLDLDHGTAREIYRFDLFETGIRALGVHPSSSLTAIGDEVGRLHLLDFADFERFLDPTANFVKVGSRVTAGRS